MTVGIVCLLFQSPTKSSPSDFSKALPSHILIVYSRSGTNKSSFWGKYVPSVTYNTPSPPPPSHTPYSPLQHVCSHSHYLLIGHCTTPLNNTALLLHLNLLHLFRESGKRKLLTSTLDDLKNLMLEKQNKSAVQFFP